MGYKLELYAYLQKREGDRSDQFLGDTIYIDSRVINLSTVEKGDDLQPVVKSMLIRTINLFSKDKNNGVLPTRPDTGSWLRLYDNDEFIQIEWLDASVKISASNMDSGNMIVLYVDDNGISTDYGSFNMTEILLSGEKNMICHEILEWAVLDCDDTNISKDGFAVYGTTEVLNRIETYIKADKSDDPIGFEVLFHLVQPFFFISTSDENCTKLKNNIKEYEKRFDLFNIPEEVSRNNCGAAFFVKDLDIDDEDSDALADNNDIENSVSTICDTSTENKVTFRFRIKHNGKSITYTNCTPLELFEDDIINEEEYRILEDQVESMKASSIDDSNYYDPIKHEIDRFSIEGEEE